MDHVQGSEGCTCVICSYERDVSALHQKYAPLLRQLAVDAGVEEAKTADEHEILRQSIIQNGAILIACLANWADSLEEFWGETEYMFQYQLERFDLTLAKLSGRPVKTAIIHGSLGMVEQVDAGNLFKSPDVN